MLSRFDFSALWPKHLVKKCCQNVYIKNISFPRNRHDSSKIRWTNKFFLAYKDCWTVWKITAKVWRFYIFYIIYIYRWYIFSLTELSNHISGNRERVVWEITSCTTETVIVKSDGLWVQRGIVPHTRLTDMKLPLDAQFAVENQAPKAQDSDVNIPTGSKNLKEEDNQWILERMLCGNI